jgi:hypothetical protein
VAHRPDVDGSSASPAVRIGNGGRHGVAVLARHGERHGGSRTLSRSERRRRQVAETSERPNHLTEQSSGGSSTNVAGCPFAGRFAPPPRNGSGVRSWQQRRSPSAVSAASPYGFSMTSPLSRIGGPWTSIVTVGRCARGSTGLSSVACDGDLCPHQHEEHDPHACSLAR